MIRAEALKKVTERVKNMGYDWMIPGKDLDKMSYEEIQEYADIVEEFDFIGRESFDYIIVDGFDPAKAYDIFSKWRYEYKIKKILKDEWIRRTGEPFNRLYDKYHSTKDDWGGDIRWKFFTTNKMLHSEWCEFMESYHMLAAIKSGNEDIILDAVCGKFRVFWDIIDEDVPGAKEKNKRIRDEYVQRVLDHDFNIRYSLLVLDLYEKDVERRRKQIGR